MKKQSLLGLLLMVVSLVSTAQIKFEKGYFVDNNGIRTKCLIKNVDWHDNPTQFSYKITEAEEAKTESIKNVREFSVSDLKYARATVDIDRSSERLDLLTTNRNPEFKEETLFLKLLVDGAARLYLYEQGNLRRYFYQLKEGKIQQLVYKLYQASTSKIDKNTYYRQQLWTDMKCASMKEKDAMSTEYKRNSLKRYFLKYNKCINPDFVNVQEREERDLFNLNIRPGIDFSSMSIPSDFFNFADNDGFENISSFRFGIEAEFVLPFNKNKWALFVEPTYRSYKSEINLRPESVFQNPNPDEVIFRVDYTSIELPVGLRYYMFLNNQAKVFINAAYVSDFVINSELYLERGDQTLDLRSTSNFAAGLGFKFKDRYSIETRFLTKRRIRSIFDYNSFSVILGYSLF